MNKKFFLTAALLGAVMLVSGCATPLKGESRVVDDTLTLTDRATAASSNLAKNEMLWDTAEQSARNESVAKENCAIWKVARKFGLSFEAAAKREDLWQQYNNSHWCGSRLRAAGTQRQVDAEAAVLTDAAKEEGKTGATPAAPVVVYPAVPYQGVPLGENGVRGTPRPWPAPGSYATGADTQPPGTATGCQALYYGGRKARLNAAAGNCQ